MTDQREFEAWERRDVESGHPYSTWTRVMLNAIEAGVHLLPDGTWVRAS